MSFPVFCGETDNTLFKFSQRSFSNLPPINRLRAHCKQVGFFKKNPMKRSAAVYLLCVCLAVSISRKWTLTDEHAIF